MTIFIKYNVIINDYIRKIAFIIVMVNSKCNSFDIDRLCECIVYKYFSFVLYNVSNTKLEWDL